MRLLLFSGSQSPLATRHPRPKSTSALTLPPLVHRALHTALDPEAPSAVVSSGTLVIPQPGALARHALAQGETEFETTVRIQLCRADADRVVASVSEALAVLEQLKGLGSVDVVLLGLPEGVDQQTWVSAWQTLTSAPFPAVANWGTFNLGQPTLSALCDVRAPYVNELDVRDCETLPREVISYAKSKGIMLWASGGGTGFDPLPSAELHNLLHEFRPKLAALVPGTDTSALAALVVPAPGGEGYEGKAGVAVEWVLSYTLFSRTRNIVRDKGYIISAAI